MAAPKNAFLLAIALLLLSSAAFSQERQLLEDRRQKLLEEINKTETLLTDTKKNAETALIRLKTLQKQVQNRRSLIETLEAEVVFADGSVAQAQQIINALQADLSKLFGEYAQMTRLAYRQKLTMGRLVFLFSSRNMNDAFRRWQYLRQYDRYREKQIHLIRETQTSLNQQVAELENRKQEKQALLDDAQRQTRRMEKEAEEKNQLVKALKSDEGRLLADLRKQRKAHEDLNAAIEKIIRGEMAKARKAERQSDSAPAVAEAAESSSRFENVKGRLIWPVQNGAVTGNFGRQEHPAISGVYISNNGIDIRTDLDAPVHCIFPGEVVGVQFIPGYGSYMAIVRHGAYYTVYSNLEEVAVKRGQSLRAREFIGKVRTDPKTNTAEVHFEVWKEKNRMDPLEWLGPK